MFWVSELLLVFIVQEAAWP